MSNLVGNPEDWFSHDAAHIRRVKTWECGVFVHLHMLSRAVGKTCSTGNKNYSMVKPVFFFIQFNAPFKIISLIETSQSHS